VLVVVELAQSTWTAGVFEIKLKGLGVVHIKERWADKNQDNIQAFCLDIGVMVGSFSSDEEIEWGRGRCRV
jgi:hypothetical protein